MTAFERYQRTKNEERLYEDNWFVNPNLLNLHFDKILGKGAFATIYKGVLKGESPLYQIHKSIATQKFQDCENAVK
uniref:Protein kinase domain-containing protein n=1 Tax=Acrobeloides nanus TaxID=290746 RepID=A0A914E815_9BILA